MAMGRRFQKESYFGRILWRVPNVFNTAGIRAVAQPRAGGADARTTPRSRRMKRTVVRYKTKPEMAEENARLIEKVFEELRAKSPEGVRYLALRLGDGTFVHFSSVDSPDGVSVIPRLEAFGLFQSGIKERCVEPPQSSNATIVGNYRMLGE
jgi:hypothetical protein